MSMSAWWTVRRAALAVAAAIASGPALAQQVVSTLIPPVAGPTTVTTIPMAASNWKLIGSTGQEGCVQHWDPASASSRRSYRQA
ncbi:MAG TPA: hypothetical protein VGM74_18405, partial [Burkholderiaceae bacterium]